MHPALKRLIDANAELNRAQAALEAAQDQRRQCALGLVEIEDDDERWQAALLAYREFGKGLSLALAEAVTGLPGRRAQSTFLERAGRRENQPKGHGSGSFPSSEPMTEWPAPDALEQDVIRSHIAHQTPYRVDQGLGWGRLTVSLAPADAAIFLEDPTGGLARGVGLTREEFVEYLSSAGSVQCDGKTQKGTRCRAGVAGRSSQMNIKAWKMAKDRGGYCTRHGGDQAA